MTAKFQFEITDEQQDRAINCFPEYGMRKAIMSRVLDEVMDLIEEHGFVVLSILLDKTVKPRTIIPSLAKAEREAKR